MTTHGEAVRYGSAADRSSNGAFDSGWNVAPPSSLVASPTFRKNGTDVPSDHPV